LFCPRIHTCGITRLDGPIMAPTPRSPVGSTSLPQCGKCQKPMAFMTTIERVTEPGRVMIYQCPDCEKLDFRPEDEGRGAAGR
jgi:hypothetical protein